MRSDSRLLRSELALVFRRRRTLVVLAILAITPVLLAAAWRTGGGRVGAGALLLAHPDGSGLLSGVFALALCVPLLLPVAVTMVAAESLSGERAGGTLCGLLLAPVNRARLLLVKFAAATAFAVVAVLVVLVTGTAAGVWLFGVHAVSLPTGGQLSVPATAVRIGLVAGYAVVSLVGLIAVGLFVSAVCDVPVAAVCGTVVLVLLAQLGGGLGALDALRPWLFTDPWPRLDSLLHAPPDWNALAHNGIVQGGYLLCFGTLAWLRFGTRQQPG